MFDLHIHTTATPHHSTWKPEDLVRHAFAHGLEIIAATDHNTTASVAALIAAGAGARSLVALVPDAQRWGSSSDEHEDAVKLLANHGWTLARFSPGDTVPDAWARVPR